MARKRDFTMLVAAAATQAAATGDVAAAPAGALAGESENGPPKLPAATPAAAADLEDRSDADPSAPRPGPKNGSPQAADGDRLAALLQPRQRIEVFGVLVEVPSAQEEPVVVMTVKVPRLLHGALKRRALELSCPLQELVRLAVEELLERLAERN